MAATNNAVVEAPLTSPILNAPVIKLVVVAPPAESTFANVANWFPVFEPNART
jgi:hypothetical protein